MKLARCVVASSDVVVYEDLKVKNLIKNCALEGHLTSSLLPRTTCPSKSISDAAWSQFTQYLQYFGKVFGRIVVAVPPEYTSQDCFACGARLEKSLSTRTHESPKSRIVLDRHQNAAINILVKALRLVGIEVTNTVGHTGFQAWGDRFQ